MSSEASRWVMKQTSGHKGLSKFVLLALAEAHDSRGRHRWPTQRALAEDCEVDERTIRRSLMFLEDKGWISRTHGNRNKPTEFTLHMESQPDTSVLSANNLDRTAVHLDRTLTTVQPDSVPAPIKEVEPDIPIVTTKAVSPPVEVTFEKYKRRLESSTNKVGVLGDIFIELFPPSHPLDEKARKEFFGRMAGIVRLTNSNGDLVLEQMWKGVAAQPRGHPLDYLTGAVKGVVERNGKHSDEGEDDATDRLLSDIAKDQRRDREAGTRL